MKIIKEIIKIKAIFKMMTMLEQIKRIRCSIKQNHLRINHILKTNKKIQIMNWIEHNKIIKIKQIIKTQLQKY